MGNLIFFGKFDNIDNISEIDDVDKLNLKNLKNFKPVDLKEQIGFDRDCYDVDNLENINILGGSVQSGGFIKIIQNTRLFAKLSEFELFSAGDSLEIIRFPTYFSKREI